MVGATNFLDGLSRRGALPALAWLAGAPSPAQMRDFEAASGLTFEAARRLRADLELLGFVVAEEEPVRGASKNVLIRLTPLGREVARHLVAIEEVLRSRERS